MNSVKTNYFCLFSISIYHRNNITKMVRLVVKEANQEMKQQSILCCHPFNKCLFVESNIFLIMFLTIHSCHD